MKITDSEVRVLSNLTDKKLAEFLKQTKGIKHDDIIKRAKILEQDARLNKKFMQAETLQELIDNLSQIKMEVED